MPVGTLADLVGTGLPAALRLMDRMVERGLVTRQKTKEDGRVMIVQVTDKGAALDHLSGFHLQINEALFAGFSDEERAQAFDLLHRMQADAEGALEAE
ncbi:MAG: winged helix DNA-binding protein [Pseudomonadota bacterium]